MHTGVSHAVFVYGTLKRGEINHGLLAPFVRSIDPAWAKGELFDVGLFPAMVEGSGQVRGEIVRLRAADVAPALKVLDQLEGCHPEDPDGSMYLRRVIEVRTDSGESELAYAYFYNHDHHGLPPVETLARVESGEWLGTLAQDVRSDSCALEAFGEHVRDFRYHVEGPIDGPRSAFTDTSD